MAINWVFDSNDYEEKGFSIIPEGDHRARISDVEFKTFKSGNDGFEITMEVSGHNSKVWHYLTLKKEDPKKTNQNIGSFFDSFGVVDHDLAHYRNWIGKVGAVRVKHEEYNGSTSAKVAFCLSKKNQEKLPAAQFAAMAPATAAPVITSDELPF